MATIKNVFWSRRDHPALRTDTWLVTDTGMVDGCLLRYAESRHLGVDLETTGFEPLMGAKIRLLTMSDGKVTTVFDLFRLGKVGRRKLRKFLEDPARVKILHNAKFDLKFLIHELGCDEVGPLFDTQLASQLVDLGDKYGKHDLAHVAKAYCDIALDKDIRHDWTGVLSPGQVIYASNDAAVLLPIRAELLSIGRERGLLRAYKLEFDAVQPIAQRELNGFALDQGKWMEIFEDNKRKLFDVEEKLVEMLGRRAGDNLALFDGAPTPFNLNALEQVKERLKAIGVKLPQILDQDTNKIKDTMLLDKMAQISGQHPIIALLIERARLSKAVTSYGKKFLRHMNPYTGRAHADIRQIGTVTTREVAKEPPLHGIPKQSEHRECFVAAPGHRLVWADYSQIELRILAEFSGDRNMLQAFEMGLDLHKQTASLIFGVDYESVVTIQRRRAKDINFGKPYGVGMKRLAERGGISEEAADKMMRDHDKKYPQQTAYLNDAASHARVYGWVQTISGKVITFKYDKNDKRQVGAVGRHGKNYPIQGSSADITKRAERLVHDELRALRPKDGSWPVKMVHVIHDEVVLEAREDHVARAQELLHRCMVQAGEEYLKVVPVVVDVSDNTYWAKAKED